MLARTEPRTVQRASERSRGCRGGRETVQAGVRWLSSGRGIGAGVFWAAAQQCAWAGGREYHGLPVFRCDEIIGHRLDAETLAAYIEDPKAVVSGTRMIFWGSVIGKRLMICWRICRVFRRLRWVGPEAGA